MMPLYLQGYHTEVVTIYTFSLVDLRKTEGQDSK